MHRAQRRAQPIAQFKNGARPCVYQLCMHYTHKGHSTSQDYKLIMLSPVGFLLSRIFILRVINGMYVLDFQVKVILFLQICRLSLFHSYLTENTEHLLARSSAMLLLTKQLQAQLLVFRGSDTFVSFGITLTMNLSLFNTVCTCLSL